MTKAIADITPKWYLKHKHDEVYVGPFPNRIQAITHKAFNELDTYVVVRTSKSHPEATPRWARKFRSL